jgi:hypothetical protein
MRHDAPPVRAKPAPALLELRSVMLHPSQNGSVCEVNAALVHHGNQISIAQLDAQIAPDTQNHDLLVKMPTF